MLGKRPHIYDTERSPSSGPIYDIDTTEGSMYLYRIYMHKFAVCDYTDVICSTLVYMNVQCLDFFFENKWI